MSAAVATTAERPTDLVERESELATIEQVVDELAEGSGRVLLITGPAGVGKTRLLRELRSGTDDKECTTLFARAGELERDFPFGVVRQLFEPMLVGRDEGPDPFAGSAASAEAIFADSSSAEGLDEQVTSFAALNGLYWMTVNIANEQPLALVIDDLQWCDRPSLNFIAFLARRIEGMPLLIGATIRSTDPGTDPALLGEITFDPSAIELRPSPLSESGVAQVLDSRLGESVAGDLAEGAFAATGGNPLMLRELAGAIESNAADPAAEASDLVREVGAQSVARTVNLRMARLSPQTRAVAGAASVLGESAALRTLATFTGQSEQQVATAIAELVASEILLDEMPPAFVHPLIRDAVYSETTRSERQLEHVKAARMLSELGYQRANVAGQLLRAPVAADDWVAGQLTAAGVAAFSSGAPESAIAYLGRALEEGAPGIVRPQILLQLGIAEAITSGVAAVVHLDEAYRTLEDTDQRIAALDALARTLIFTSEPMRAAELLEAEIERLPEDQADLRMQLEALAAMAVFFEGGARYELANLVPHREGPIDDTLGAKAIAAMAAIDWTYRGGPRDACCGTAIRAMEDGQLLGDDQSLIAIAGIATLIYQDHPRSIEFLDKNLQFAREAGSLLGVSSVSLWRGAALLQRGDLAGAIEAIETSTAEFRIWGMGAGAGRYASGFLTAALAEAGDIEGAKKAFARSSDTGGFEESNRIYLGGRASIEFAEGRHEDVIATADEIRARYPEMVGFAFVRSQAYKARSLAALGRLEEAREVAEVEVSLARKIGSPAAMGAALRAVAATESGDQQIATLREAVRELQPSSDRLERAYAVYELGTALAQADQRDEAVELLGTALDVARECGAEPLAARAAEALAESGVRTGAGAGQGAASLTPSERRVAELARSGLTNREIAEQLFVTPKTVEVHLSKTYEKLGIRSRKDLATALPEAA